MGICTDASRIVRRSAVLLALLAFIAALMTATAPTARATVLEPLTIEELAARATTVVLVETTATSPVTVKAANGQVRSIQTAARVHTSRVLKGTPAKDFNVVTPGGKQGDLTMVVEGMPVFLPGQQCILFLDEQNRVIGGSQGKVDISDGKVIGSTQSLEAVCADVSAALDGRRDAGGSTTSAGTTLSTDLAVFTVGQPAEASTRAAASGGPQYSISGLSDGFESGLGNWSTSGTATWAATTYRAQSGSHSAYCVGSSIAAPGPYVNNTDARMWVGPFDLSSCNVGSLEFDLWLNSEVNYDRAQCLISTDGINYYGYGWSGNTGGWVPITIDLRSVPNGSGGSRDVTGQGSVWVMFRFVSDSLVSSYEGAYIDDVVVSAAYVLSPTITVIAPGNASAGTGSEVTITGTDFGASQGSGHVDFFYKTGQPTISAPIISWSDTSIVAVVPTAEVNGYPASAGSGPVTVTNSDGGVSVGYPFEVTFGYGGVRQSDSTCTYVLNPNTSDTTSEESLFDAGAVTWNGLSAFEFVDGGGASATNFTLNGSFEVFWTSTLLPSGVLAAAGYWYAGSTLVEADIGFNDLYTWSTGTTGTYDIQSIAVHELGHWLNLRDLYGAPDSSKVMYGLSGSGQQRRILDQDDIAGIVWIYGGPLAITGLAPTSGSTAGGTTVVITGTDFTDVTEVAFGTEILDLSDYTVDSDTQITATSPAHAAGTVQVKVTTDDGDSADTAADNFTYVVAPAVSGLSPTAGPTAGGATVTITGTDFTDVTEVAFGGTAATGLSVNPAGTQITATSPAHAAGPVQVRVTTAGGPSADTSADDFSYIAAPAITGLDPVAGPTAGGTTVTITGTDFTDVTEVAFGGTAATGVSVNPAGTQITATSPAHAAGPVQVRVTAVGGSSADVPGDEFNYVNAPAVISLGVSRGPASGGTTVVITGTDFLGVGNVFFGDDPAIPYTVDSDTQITATAPAHAAGPVQVRVVTAYGSSADGSGDDFTYVNAPAITGLAPNAGPLAGGTTVIITGTDFTNVSAVTFAGVVATTYNVDSSTQITATSPAHIAGAVQVRVMAVGGVSEDTAADDFTYLATTRYDDKDSKITYAPAWSRWDSSGYWAAFGDTYGYSDKKGDKVLVTFEGTSLDLIACTSNTKGKALVTLDPGTPGAATQTVDLYSTSTLWKQKVYSTGPIAYGTHTLVVECLYEKRGASAWYTIDLDAFDIVGTLVQSPPVTKIDDKDYAFFTYAPDIATGASTSAWSRWDNSNYWAASDDTYAYTDQPGYKATFTFNGTYAAWLACTSNTKGKALVTVDGDTAHAKTVDLYSSSTLWKQKVYDTGMLAPGSHTVVIECLYEKRAASGWYTIDVDRFDVMMTP